MAVQSGAQLATAPIGAARISQRFTELGQGIKLLTHMRIAGFLLLLAGWGIVLSAVALLPSPTGRSAFALSGVGVEVLGLVLVTRTHISPRVDRS